MPKTPPTSRKALLAPDAWPSSSGRTAESTTFATGAKKRPMPMPARMNGMTSGEARSASTIAASQPIAIACSAGPRP